MTTESPGPERRGRTRLVRDGAVARLVFDNPGARNALTTAMYEQLEAGCHELAGTLRCGWW